MKNELCSRGVFDAYAGEDFVGPAIDGDRKIVRLAASGRRGLRADAVDQSDRHAVLQGGAGDADAQRDHPQPASARQGMLGRCRRPAGRRPPAPRARRTAAIQVVREPTMPLVDPADAGPARRPGARDRRAGDGRGRLSLRPSGARRRSRQCAGLRCTRPPMSPLRRGGWSTPRRSTTRSSAPTSRSCSRSRRSPTACSTRCGARGRMSARPEEVERLRAALWDAEGGFNVEGALGKDAATIARARRASRSPRARAFSWRRSTGSQPEEPFAREKLAPVLGFARVADGGEAAAAARAMMRAAGARPLGGLSRA